MLVHCRDADAQLLRRILIRHSFPIAQSDDGSSLVGQVMVDAIHRSLPSLFQTRRFFLRQFLFRERKKPFQSFISFLSGYKIDAEWEKLKEEKQQKEEMNQNAETQQTAKLFPLWSPMRKVAAVAAVLVVSGITFAAIHLVTRSHQASDKHNTELVASQKDSIQQVSAPQKSNIEEKTDSASLAQLPLVYENAELQNILTPIAGHFHLQVTYQNESARHIRLFLQLEKNMSLDDIIELLNHFEKVNIRHEGQTLIVE